MFVVVAAPEHSMMTLTRSWTQPFSESTAGSSPPMGHDANPDARGFDGVGMVEAHRRGPEGSRRGSLHTNGTSAFASCGHTVTNAYRRLKFVGTLPERARLV